MVSVAGLALLAPLMLSACVADGDRMTGTAAVAPDGAAPSADGKPVLVTLNEAKDGGPTRIALPANRPDPAVMVAEARTRVTTPDQREAPRRSASERAVEVASAAGESVRSGVSDAKDTVVAGASKVGTHAAKVVAVGAATAQTVAQAVQDTITGSPEIDQMIAAAADENDIPRELAFAVVRVESHYNPRAKGAGVYGLSQIKPATARGLGFSGSAEDLFDPETNLRYGMRYLKGAWEQGGGDVCQAAMKYKGGHRTTTMSKSASVYCSNVKRHMASYRTRKSPAMSPDATLVAAVEPTVRKGLIARTVAASPKPMVEARTATPILAKAPVPTLPGVSSNALVAPTAAAPAPVPAAAPAVKVAENRPVPAAASAKPASAKGDLGGRVHRAVAEPDANRFGGAFDASGPSTDAPAGGLGFN